MPPLPSSVSPTSDTFRANAEAMRALVDDLAAKAATVERGGPKSAYANAALFKDGTACRNCSIRTALQP